MISDFRFITPPGRFVEIEEKIEDACIREMKEKMIIIPLKKLKPDKLVFYHGDLLKDYLHIKTKSFNIYLLNSNQLY